MKTKIVAIVAAAFVALCIVGRVNVATYNAANTGLVVTAFGHCAGIEVRGVPGVFTNCD